jgi:hypothetical protein
MNALLRLADTAFDVGDDREAERRAEVALARSTAVSWGPGVAWAQRLLGGISLARGDHASARQRFEASLASARKLGNRLLSAQALVYLGQEAVDRSDLPRGRQHLAEALELARTVEDHAAMARCFEVFGALAIAAGHISDGVHLVGSAATLRQAARTHLSPREQRWLDKHLARARAALGATAIDRAQLGLSPRAQIAAWVIEHRLTIAGPEKDT